MNHLINPHGGTLVGLVAGDDRVAAVRETSRDWPSFDLNPQQICDLELLLNGGFSPLSGYMGQIDFDAVCRNMRLQGGTMWPVPITLDISDDLADRLIPGKQLALRDREGVMLAAMTVAEVWEPDRSAELVALFGDDDRRRPEVRRYAETRSRFAAAGPVEGVQLPVHYDYRELRLTPAELRRKFARLGWRRILAFQTHQTMHRVQQVLTERSAQEIAANLLLHPVVGHSRPGDPDHYTRVRCYLALLDHYPRDMARLSLLPLASRHAGTREAVLQAIVHKNHGCSHFMVEPGTGGSILEVSGAPAYDPEEARAFIEEHTNELEVVMVPYREMVYAEQQKDFVALAEVSDGVRVASTTGAEVRDRLAAGRELPGWFTFPEVERELRQRHPPRHSQGFTVFFTGLSGAGKSTIANALRVKLMELGGRGVTLLDGDLVRKNLSSELGFSREHRDLNVHRIGFVAAEITRAGGVAICAPIAPYDEVRREVRSMIEPWGGFILVQVATPLEVCEARDRKGMYAKARAGIIKGFTGIDDPYEPPENAEIVVDTSKTSVDDAIQEIIAYLEREGYLRPDA